MKYIISINESEISITKATSAEQAGQRIVDMSVLKEEISKSAIKSINLKEFGDFVLKPKSEDDAETDRELINFLLSDDCFDNIEDVIFKEGYHNDAGNFFTVLVCFRLLTSILKDSRNNKHHAALRKRHHVPDHKSLLEHLSAFVPMISKSHKEVFESSIKNIREFPTNTIRIYFPESRLMIPLPRVYSETGGQLLNLLDKKEPVDKKRFKDLYIELKGQSPNLDLTVGDDSYCKENLLTLLTKTEHLELLDDVLKGIKALIKAKTPNESLQKQAFKTLLNQQDENGLTLLSHAVHQLNPNLINFLVKQGSNPNRVSTRGSTPLSLLADTVISSSKEVKFSEKIRDELLESLRMMLDNGANPNQNNHDKDARRIWERVELGKACGFDTPLTSTLFNLAKITGEDEDDIIKKDYLEKIIKLIKDKGGDVNAVVNPDTGDTALHNAALQLLICKFYKTIWNLRTEQNKGTNTIIDSNPKLKGTSLLIGYYKKNQFDMLDISKCISPQPSDNKKSIFISQWIRKSNLKYLSAQHIHKFESRITHLEEFIKKCRELGANLKIQNNAGVSAQEIIAEINFLKSITQEEHPDEDHASEAAAAQESDTESQKSISVGKNRYALMADDGSQSEDEDASTEASHSNRKHDIDDKDNHASKKRSRKGAAEP